MSKEQDPIQELLTKTCEDEKVVSPPVKGKVKLKDTNFSSRDKPRIVKVRMVIDGFLGVLDGKGNIVQEIPLQHIPGKQPVIISTLDEEGFGRALAECLSIQKYYQTEIDKSIELEKVNERDSSESNHARNGRR